MNKFEFLKSIVESEHGFFSLSRDNTPEEHRFVMELLDCGFLYEYSNYSYRPTKNGRDASRFNSFEDYDVFLQSQQRSSTTTITTHITGVGYVNNESYTNSPVTQKTEESIFTKIFKWLISLFNPLKS